jgi:hypothetical protein
MWCDDVAGFAEHEAERLSAGDYGLTDLVSAQVELARIWVRNSMRVASTLSDNVALLSYGRPAGGPATRTVQVSVPVPANVEVALQVSDLWSPLHRIPRSKIRLEPSTAASSPAPAEIPVTVHVECAGAPADTYTGTISSADGGVDVTFKVAIDELGEPLP